MASAPRVPLPAPRRLAGRHLGAWASAAAFVLAAAATLLWLRARPAPPPSATPSAASAAESSLKQELVRKQVQLARRELEDKNYAAAATEAEGALKLAPGDAEAKAVLDATRGRQGELDRAIAESRRLLGSGDTAGASRELSHALELDPRHPAAAELSAGLNSVFRAQADEAAASTREARAAALAAGATAWSLRSVDAGVSQADELLARREFADATRTYLEARDAFDRARRDALQRRGPTPAPPPAAAPSTPAPAAAALPTPLGPTSAPVPKPATAEANPPPAAAPTPTVPPAHSFTAEATSVATPSAGGIEGFDTADVSARRSPQFTGRMEFEVLPLAVRAGEPFVVRIHLRNDGRRAVRVRGVRLAAVVDGRRRPAAVKPLQREVPPQSRALVAEYSGVWTEAASWALEAVVTADRDETVTSRLRAN
jgi:tetratricopeptide (TPR) repeat protein